MKPRGEASTPIWREDVSRLFRRGLDSDAEADVCVIGAGIAGMTTAYLLAREGLSVVLLDDGAVGSGQTSHTTAHLSNAIDDRYTEIERLHGQDGARLAAESHTAAIDRIESIAGEEGIACDFARVDGFLIAGPGDSDLIQRERDAAHRAGLTEVELLPAPPFATFGEVPCLRFPRQGQFHPLKYLNGLADTFQKRRGRLFTGAHVERIQGDDPARVWVAGGALVTARAVVVATNTPINDMLAIHTKQAPYMTYAIGLRVVRGAFPHALYWDTLDPYHYVRTQPSPHRPEAEDVLIVGGEDHKTGQADDTEGRYARLEDWARHHFADLGGVAYRWCGQVMETVDGLAFIGKNPGDADNVFIATGDSGMGMTHGTIAGILLTDLILGRTNPWAKLYDPARKPITAAGEFLKENLNVAEQYLSWVTPGEVSAPEQVRPGTGAVLRRGLTKVAVYRDEQGGVHECSAVCPHLGCIVAWNDADKTWDCPCHGSRFDRFGQVVNGPANQNLKQETQQPAGRS